MSGGGTGKRDRQRAGREAQDPAGWLSRPHKTSCIRARGPQRDLRGWGQAGGPSRGWVALAGGSAPGRGGGCGTPSPAGGRDAPVPAQPGGRAGTQSTRLGEEMEDDNRTEPWHRSLQAMLDALNQTLHGAILRPAAPHNASARAGRDDNAYMYILFVMTLFAATVGSLILGYTRSRKVDKRSDPYHVYIKNRVSMI
ncbi:potassium voltage-gated channel subfamily E member 3 isoform X2 [Oxyura jamaicensis]|uniref:potassium voltage-gated channel subfamily E member 3 isoform X2 n=1 Tax=Oxyura jamaicensis TaxID=8884 RepID=UPI0015A50F90|nr:potassium voltage-gated channel subfamily E member 3 isoform X2 [Oxyura jamaicensis]